MNLNQLERVEALASQWEKKANELEEFWLPGGTHRYFAEKLRAALKGEEDGAGD